MSILDVNAVYALLKEVFLVLDDGDQFLFARFGLSVTRFYALDHLKQTPGISLRELSGLLLCDKSNVTRIVKTLESEGLVIRQPHETDRRSSRLYLTEKGGTLQAQVLDAHEHFNKLRFESAINTIENSDVISVMTKLKDLLELEADGVKERVKEDLAIAYS